MLALSRKKVEVKICACLMQSLMFCADGKVLVLLESQHEVSRETNKKDSAPVDSRVTLPPTNQWASSPVYDQPLFTSSLEGAKRRCKKFGRFWTKKKVSVVQLPGEFAPALLSVLKPQGIRTLIIFQRGTLPSVIRSP